MKIKSLGKALSFRVNFLALALIAFSFSSTAQVYQNDVAYGRQYKRVQADTTLLIPSVCGTPTLRSTVTNRAAIAFDSCNAKFYVYNPSNTTWSEVTGSGGGSGTTKYSLQGYGIILDSTADTYTITLDTAVIADASTGGNTTIFETVLDSTGQPNNRVLFSRGTKISSSPRFLFDTTNSKLVINHNNISAGGANTKLFVQGNQTTTGQLTVQVTPNTIDTTGTKPAVLNSSGVLGKMIRWPVVNDPAKQDALNGTGYVKMSGTTPSYLTPTQATADLNVFTSGLKGLAPASGGGTTNYLRADGTWAAPAGGGGGSANVYAPLKLSGDTVILGISPMEYGLATGASSAVNTYAINTAIAAAATAGNVPVYFPAGTFECDSILYNPLVPLIGQGSRVTVLKSTQAKPLLYYNSTVYKSGILIKNILLNGDSIGTTGLRLTSASDFYFDDVYVTNFTDYGFHFSGVLIGTFNNCLFSYNDVSVRNEMKTGTNIGDLAPNLCRFVGGSIARSRLGVDWDNGSMLIFDHVNMDYNGVDGDLTSGVVRVTNMSSSTLDQLAVSITNCWGEGNAGITLNIGEPASQTKSVIDKSQIVSVSGAGVYAKVTGATSSNTLSISNSHITGAVTTTGTFAYVDGVASTVNSADFNALPNLVLGKTGATPLIMKSSTPTAYASWRIYNDQNSSSRALEAAYAGSTYASSLLTGSPTGEAASIATTGAYPLSLGTNNTARITILPTTGYVGIGTAAPTRPLELSAPGGTSPRFQINGNSSTDYGVVQFQNDLGTLSSGFFQNGSANSSYAGTGSLNMLTFGASPIGIGTNNTVAVTISTAQLVRFNAYTAGTATFDGSGNITSSSDRRIKNNIKPFKAGLAEVLKLKPASFIYNQDKSKTVMHGFIAQEVQAVIPGAVHKANDKQGTLSLETNAIIAALVNGMQEQQKQIDALKAEVKALKK